MELYFKGDQNSALSVRHVYHILESKSKNVTSVFESLHELKDDIQKISEKNEDLKIKEQYEEVSSYDTYIEDEMTTLIENIKNLSIEDNIAPSRDVIYTQLQNINQQLVEMITNYQRSILTQLYDLNEEIEQASFKSKNTIIERVTDSKNNILGYLESIKRISLIEMYNQSGNHRNNKLDELENTTALSKWISLLKLEPTLKNFIKSKYEFLIKLAVMHIESKVEEGSKAEIEFAKECFVRDAMYKLFDEYYELLVSQIRQNLMANEDRDLIITRLQTIVQAALERHLETISELFDEAYDTN